MVRPLRHRQTKGAENGLVSPTITASHPDSTDLRQSPRLFTRLAPKGHLPSNYSGIIAMYPFVDSHNNSHLMQLTSGGVFCGASKLKSFGRTSENLEKTA